ncbi:hypothetical protein [Nostoc sp.]
MIYARYLLLGVGSGNECWNIPVVEFTTSAKPSLWKLAQEMRSLNTQTSTEILCYSA